MSSLDSTARVWYAMPLEAPVMPTSHSLDMREPQSVGRVSRFISSWIRLPNALDGACSAFAVVGAYEILEMVDVNNLESYEDVTAQAWTRVGDSMRVAVQSHASIDST